MMLSSPVVFHLAGQKVVYNSETKIAKTTIAEPFYKAGKILGWKNTKRTVGLGLNPKIVEFILKSRCTLIIHVAKDQKDYWLRPDVLSDFVKYNNTEYKAGGKLMVHVIPWELCTRYQITENKTT